MHSRLVQAAFTMFARDALSSIASQAQQGPSVRISNRETPPDLLAPSTWPQLLEVLRDIQRQAAPLARERRTCALQGFAALVREDFAGARTHFTAAKKANENHAAVWWRFFVELEDMAERLSKHT